MAIHVSDHHDSLAGPALLDKIDKLFACNVAQRVEASNLQSLDNAAFSMMMSEVSDLDVEAKTCIQVHVLMGLSTSKEDGLPTFSGNVLRLEICGPEEDHLSVIDVPGIFRNTTPGVTTKQDKDMVREMVLDYMRNPRSIMLTVVPANVDIATQEIIDMAKEVDPDGRRTLGVLTKPDLIDKGAESRVIDLVEDREMRLKLGWILVRNLGEMELQEGLTDRDAAEERFRLAAPWNVLSKDRFGIKALKTRLQETVTANAREAFPHVRGEISRKLRDCQNELEGLGAEREAPEQQLGYLLGIMNSFQAITQQALSTNYSYSDYFDKHTELRFATRIVNRNDTFSNDMALWGHRYRFARESENEDSSDSEKDRDDEESVDSLLATVEVARLEVRKVSSMPELEDLVYNMEINDVFKPKTQIRPWIEKQYRDSRGFEIGTFSFTLLSTTMKQQSDHWTSIARGYISDVVTMTHEFISKALDIVCPDHRVRHNLMSALMDRLLSRYKNVIDKVNFLLNVERSGTPMTLNHYLNSNLEKCRQNRFSSAIAKKTFDDCSHGEVVRLQDLNHQHHMSNETHAVQDIYDILQSYYKVARKRFVDNICMQAVDYHLVTGPETPMKLFSPSFVGGLSTEQLEAIAGEEGALKRKRRQLIKKIKDLQEARRILF